MGWWYRIILTMVINFCIILSRTDLDKVKASTFEWSSADPFFKMANQFLGKWRHPLVLIDEVSVIMMTRSLMNKPTCCKCNYQSKEWPEMFYGFYMRSQIKATTQPLFSTYANSVSKFWFSSTKETQGIGEDLSFIIHSTKKFPRKPNASFLLNIMLLARGFQE